MELFQPCWGDSTAKRQTRTRRIEVIYFPDPASEVAKKILETHFIGTCCDFILYRAVPLREGKDKQVVKDKQGLLALCSYGQTLPQQHQRMHQSLGSYSTEHEMDDC